MSFYTNANVSPAAEAAIKHLIGSGESEAIYVGEALWEIASNGDDAATDTALVVSAQEIIASAQAFINAVSPTRSVPPLTLTKADVQELFSFIDAVESTVGCDIFTDATEANIPFQVGVLKANATNLADFKKRLITNNTLAQSVEAANDDQDNQDDETETELTIHYAHYDCPVDPKITWDDTYECACDSDCPACGTKNIEAVSWHSTDETCTEKCDPHHDRSAQITA